HGVQHTHRHHRTRLRLGVDHVVCAVEQVECVVVDHQYRATGLDRALHPRSERAQPCWTGCVHGDQHLVDLRQVARARQQSRGVQTAQGVRHLVRLRETDPYGRPGLVQRVPESERGAQRVGVRIDVAEKRDLPGRHLVGQQARGLVDRVRGRPVVTGVAGVHTSKLRGHSDIEHGHYHRSVSSEYLILQLPSANRVYAEDAPRLMRAELAAFSEAVGGIADIDDVELGGLRYVRFTTPELTEQRLALLSNASSLYGLFERVQPDLLRPVRIRPLDKFDSDLLTIQKYSGKTNEQFTRLLLNVTCLAMAEPLAMLRRPLHVLDPLCGRGTTLNQAMMYGFDATGVELLERDFEAYERFIKTWLRTKRFKHTAESGQL